ncbi:MAG: VIT domain-containing protein [Thermodesulfobacteriota bacterium]|jgi:Ca-activated chloride channel family protein
MIFTTRFLAVLAAAAAVFGATAVHSQPRESDDRTLSPYFFVKSDDPEIDQLPLKSTSAAVDISGVIADVQVTQVYQNQGKRPLEAIYVFPASNRAAVYGLKMVIGERVINAQINKREVARRVYEQARDQGKSASLLEQQRPNVFQMNVANIMPGDEIKVELKYTELLVPTDRVYEFVYPTVVGPRYSNQPAETASPSEQWVQNPYLHQGEAPHYTFDIQVNIAAGLPIKELHCTSHKATANFDGPSVARVMLDKSEAYGGTRDYILRYRLDGDRIQSGLLLYQGKVENFFLLMMQPPKRVTKAQIPGREYIFIVDVSGSMNGFPIEISKKLLKDLIGHLSPTDRFNVLLFSGGSSVMSEESLPATPENIHEAIHLIERQQGGGGTELLPALERALMLKKPENYSRSIVIATDGYVTVEEEVFDLIRQNLGDANMLAFGIGTAVNRHIIEGMARVGMGEPFIITRPEEASSKAERFRTLIQSPVLTQVKVKFQNFSTYDVEPLSIPDVLAERPVIVFGKWRGQPLGKINLSGISGNGPYSEAIEINKVKPLESNSALRYLWARHRITLLSDYNKLRSNDKRIKEVTDLGLSYNLLTAYTSFVAVDTEVRNNGGQQTTIKQPLPLPQGVSDYAIGSMKSAQAPASFMARKEAPAPMEDKLLREQRGEKEKNKRTITLGDVNVSEGVSKEAILNLIEKKAHELEKCSPANEHYEKFVIELLISPNGKVRTAKIVSILSKNKGAERCFLEEIQKWQFPITQDGRGAKVTISLTIGS